MGEWVEEIPENDVKNEEICKWEETLSYDFVVLWVTKSYKFVESS